MEIRASDPLCLFSAKWLFSLISVGLLCDQGMVIKVIDLHGLFDIIKSPGGNFFSFHASFVQNLVNIRDTLFPFLTSCSDRGELLLKDVVQEFLNLHITKTASCIVIL